MFGAMNANGRFATNLAKALHFLPKHVDLLARHGGAVSFSEAAELIFDFLWHGWIFLKIVWFRSVQAASFRPCGGLNDISSSPDPNFKTTIMSRNSCREQNWNAVVTSEKTCASFSGSTQSSNRFR
jgi:hypothetical protein